MISDATRHALDQVWTGALGGDPGLLDRVSTTGPDHALASPFPVTDVAAACIAAATLAAAEHQAVRRTGSPLQRPDQADTVAVDRIHAAVAVTSESAVRVDGHAPVSWDPLAGDYQGADGWIRLHTNYPWHRDAALRALGFSPGSPPDRGTVAAEVTRWNVVELETAVVAQRGCAAAMRSEASWREHPQGRAVAELPLVGTETFGRPAPQGSRPGPGEGPLAGIRVLDLTRVIAGPLAGKILAAHGAQVLRIDPPGFQDVPSLVADTTVGKRASFLDLKHPEQRSTFLRLVAGADVVVHGYRPGALSAAGLADELLADVSPGLVIGRISAWGRSGPWQDRRGFDSLVQMASGIAAEGMHTYGVDRPRPLPCQLLDHASGWLLAAGILRALTSRLADGSGRRVTVTLARTGRWIQDVPRTGDPTAGAPTEAQVAHWCHEHPSALGTVRLADCPGTIGGRGPRWDLPPTPLGAAPASWV